MDKAPEEFYGKTYIRGEEIIWDTGKVVIQRIPIQRIKIIGEYTSSAGSQRADWFYLFILHENDLREISAYAGGSETMLAELSTKLNTHIIGKLANSTDWETNILWPTTFRGQELFKLTNKIPTTFFRKKSFKLGYIKKEIELTEELKRYLRDDQL